MQVKFHWAWMLPILLLSAYLGIVLINYDAIWFDEWITYFISGTPPYSQAHRDGTICEEFLSGDSHSYGDTLCYAAIDNSWPPLYFSLQMLWAQFSQGHYFMDRSLAWLIGLIAIAATYRLGRSLYNVKTGLTAALLLGTSVFLSHYMHEIRGYTLYVLLSALNGLLYWELLKKPKAGRALRWGFALSIVASLYTHYISIAVVFGIGLYHVLLERPAKAELWKKEGERTETAEHWIRVLKLYINGCLVFGLWVAVLIISYVNSASLDRSIPLLDLLQAMMTGFSNNLIPLALILIAFSLAFLKEQQMRFLWVWALCILGVAILGNIYADFLFHPRHIIGMMPAFMCILAVALLRIPRFGTIIGSVLLLIWMGAGIFYSHSSALMNSLPKHIDTVPLAAMNSIVETAELCGSSDVSFILGINTPDEEWVQDHPIRYYLGNYPMQFISLSRIVNDDWVKLQESSLLPAELEAGTVEDRFQYFTDDAEAVYFFTLPNQPLEAGIEQLESLLSEAGFSACEDLYNRSDLLGRVFVRDTAQCEVILASCR